ncbi:protein PYRICULARIA ORYZAE RESISTANCE 21 [Nicotiana sylvestris]|uniref:Uncharacterized protein LOC104242939 n=1 Tax=Nicotiana sylvestris TaxID=4096 RepID=A0A1U7YC38_NICSY|nr:PREDICTED: uncharacterized protein LOC104242939 [Nicotiana sylvestris]
MGGDKTEKTTKMVLKVDLQCSCCYKKVKKVLCKFPQIRDQVYDEKANTVTITVVCCNPEKIRDKLCSKGCGVIKSIEIKDPEKPKKPEKPIEAEKPTVVIIEKPQKDPKPNPVAQPPQPPPPPELIMVQKYPPPPHGYCCGQCYEGHIGGPCYQMYGRMLPPDPCYDNYGPRPYGYRRGCYVSRCDEYYFTEENATGCSIM